jgi:tetratricopeptide (TPR) repeat protein
MPRRYLVGPVTAAWADQHLRRQVRQGECLVFGPPGEGGLGVGPADSWQAVCARLPPGWRPDFVVLDLAYTVIPRGLWSAPVPLVGLARDWSLLWHLYRRRARRCDLLAADTKGVERLREEGFEHSRRWNLGGCPRVFVDGPWPDGPRDVDVLFLGNLNAAVQSERTAWLPALAELGPRWRVVIQAGVFGEPYRQALARARIVFNRTRQGECNRRVFEAAAAGALLFVEEGNREVPALLRDRQECVYYNADTLGPLLRRYLENEGERRLLAEAGRAVALRHGFEEEWDGLLGMVEGEWGALTERASRRAAVAPADELLARCWEAQGRPPQLDPALPGDLEAALRADPAAAALGNALGLALGCAGFERDQSGAAAGAAEAFRRAAAGRPVHLTAVANLAAALAFAGQRDASVAQARRALALLDHPADCDPLGLDSGCFPPAYDWMRTEWERAAWENAGRPAAEAEAKRALLAWRMHTLLAELTGDISHFYEAYLRRPDLPPAQAALGAALARTGHPAEAVPYLRRALGGNPLDRTAARVLFGALGALGDAEGQRRLADERRRLSQAATQAAPAEDWFAEPGPAPPAPAEVPPPGRLPTPAAETPKAAAAAPDLVVSVAAGRPRVALSMIVKNEEANLPHCLGSIADLVDEVVVVDTGSADRTREIAARFGARVYDFPWIDNFGAARNESLSHVTARWVLWLDGDDRIDEENRRRLRKLFASLGDEKDAYVMKVRSVLDPSRGNTKLLDQVRLFPNHPEVRWRYRIHEQILPSVHRIGGDARWTDVVIDHAGYQDPALRRRKLDRNLRLLRMEDAENPNDPFNLFNLGWSLMDVGQLPEALPLLRRSLELSQPGASIVRKLYVLLTQGNQQLGRKAEALQACREGRARFPEDAELLYEEALLLREARDLNGAASCLIQLMDLRTGPYFASVDVGLRTFRARHLLGVIYREQGRQADAEAQWQAALNDQPQYGPVWWCLGELYLEQKRWELLEDACRHLESASAPVDAAVLRARGHKERKDYAAARWLLEGALALAPKSVGPWVILSHVLLAEGRDWAGAERALRQVLALDPQHAEARHNLAVLLRQQGRPPEA